MEEKKKGGGTGKQELWKKTESKVHLMYFFDKGVSCHIVFTLSTSFSDSKLNISTYIYALSSATSAMYFKLHGIPQLLLFGFTTMSKVPLGQTEYKTKSMQIHIHRLLLFQNPII